jgi:hypothetical protein
VQNASARTESHNRVYLPPLEHLARRREAKLMLRFVFVAMPCCDSLGPTCGHAAAIHAFSSHLISAPFAHE